MEQSAARANGVVAVLTLNGAAQLDPKTRKRVADWLRRQAAALESDYADMAPRFTARWMYGA